MFAAFKMSFERTKIYWLRIETKPLSVSLSLAIVGLFAVVKRTVVVLPYAAYCSGKKFPYKIAMSVEFPDWYGIPNVDMIFGMRGYHGSEYAQIVYEIIRD